MHLPMMPVVQQDQQSYRTWLQLYWQRRAKLHQFNPPCYSTIYGLCLWTGGTAGLVPFVACLLPLFTESTATALLFISVGIWTLSALVAVITHCARRFKERKDLLMELPACYRTAHKKAQKAGK